MADLLWSLLAAAIPAIVAGQALRINRRQDEQERAIKKGQATEKSSDNTSVCEMVCTSGRMLKRVVAFSKDLAPSTCVTVCGESELDACTDACARTVCLNQHHMPN